MKPQLRTLPSNPYHFQAATSLYDSFRWRKVSFCLEFLSGLPSAPPPPFTQEALVGARKSPRRPLRSFWGFPPGQLLLLLPQHYFRACTNYDPLPGLVLSVKVYQDPAMPMCPCAAPAASTLQGSDWVASTRDSHDWQSLKYLHTTRPLPESLLTPTPLQPFPILSFLQLTVRGCCLLSVHR